MKPQSIIFSFVVNWMTISVVLARPEPLPLFLVNRASVRPAVQIEQIESLSDKALKVSESEMKKDAVHSDKVKNDEVIQESSPVNDNAMDSVPINLKSEEKTYLTETKGNDEGSNLTDIDDIFQVETFSDSNDTAYKVGKNAGGYGKETKILPKVTKEHKLSNKKSNKSKQSFQLVAYQKLQQKIKMNSLIYALLDSLSITNDHLDPLEDVYSLLRPH